MPDELRRPFKVKIRARVSGEIEKEISPAVVYTMGEAVSCALDEFKDESKWDSLTIIDVSVAPAPSKDT